MTNENIEEIVNTNEMEFKPEDQPAVEPEEVKWAVTEENDGLHVRPVVDGEILDTPVEKVVTPEDIIKEEQENKNTGAVAPAVISGCAKINVRKEASKTAAIVCVIEEGTEVQVDLENSTEDFYKVSMSNTEGYCMKQFVSIK